MLTDCAHTKSPPVSIKNYFPTETMTETPNSFAQRLKAVRERIAQAAQAAGRDPDDITLLPVSKTFGEEAIQEAMACGLTRFGENKVQELTAKHQLMPNDNIDWVMIGH